jgi:hypothetical protein
MHGKLARGAHYVCWRDRTELREDVEVKLVPHRANNPPKDSWFVVISRAH